MPNYECWRDESVHPVPVPGRSIEGRASFPVVLQRSSANGESFCIGRYPRIIDVLSIKAGTNLIRVFLSLDC